MNKQARHNHQEHGEHQEGDGKQFIIKIAKDAKMKGTRIKC